MIKYLLLFMTIVGTVVAASLATPQTVAAGVGFFSGVQADCNKPGIAETAVCTSQAKDNPLTGSDGLLAKITNIVAYIAGAIAVIMIVVSAIRFVTSGSDISTNSRTDTDVESARKTITNAIIGLIVIVLGRQLIMFILNRI